MTGDETTRVAVLGLGQMGASAAACFARAGMPVLLWGRDPARHEAAVAEAGRLIRFLDDQVGPAAATTGPIEPTADLDRVNDWADFVLECIAEDLDQKAVLFARLAPAAGRGAVLASCTSGLSITAMGRGSGVGRRLVGAHFWNPPHLMPLVEVVRGDETDDGLVEATADLLRRAGKIPVVCKDVPGFVGNRLLHALFREAFHLVQEGVCTAADVDRVARLTFGLRLPALGPCENADLVGLDLVAAIEGYLFADLSDAKAPSPMIEGLRAEGRTGMRAGAGLHDWSTRSAAELVDQRDRQIVRQIAFLKEIGRLG